MTLRDKLFRWRDPYDLAGTEDLFAAAMAENAALQAVGCPDYRRILALRGLEDLTGVSPAALPPIPTLYFKRHALRSMPENRLLIRAATSGTGGVKSRCIPFEEEHISDVCACCGKPAKHMLYWGRQY